MLLRLLAILIALSPADAAAQTQETAPNGTISARSDARTDAEMETRIREILREFDEFGDVAVEVSEGVVTLSGTADSATDVAELETLATRVEGVVAIRNEVTE